MSAEQIRSITSEQALRIAAGEPLQPAGAAVGERERAPHVLLDRVAEFLLLGAISTMRGGEPAEMLALARLACDVPDEIDDAPVFAAIRGLLDGFDEYSRRAPRRPPPAGLPDRRRDRAPGRPKSRSATADYAPRSAEARSA